MEGRLTYRSFVGKDGQQKSITEIVLDDFIVFSDGKKAIEGEVKEIKEETEAQEKPEQEHKESQINENKGDESVNPDDIPF